MPGMGDLISLGPVEFPALSAKLVSVRLADGPCAGRWVSVPDNIAECWERVGKPGRVGVETQMWASYRLAPPGVWRYSGVTVTTDQLYAGLARAKADGITHGESYGA